MAEVMPRHAVPVPLEVRTVEAVIAVSKGAKTLSCCGERHFREPAGRRRDGIRTMELSDGAHPRLTAATVADQKFTPYWPGRGLGFTREASRGGSMEATHMWVSQFGGRRDGGEYSVARCKKG